MARSTGLRVAASVAAVVAAAALIGGGDGPRQLEPIDVPAGTSPYFAGYGSGASAGDDLVLIEPVSRDGRNGTVLRRDDGSWWALPPLPFFGFIQLASAGDRVVAGGFACSDRECTGDQELVFAMLAEDHSEWVRLDGPRAVYGAIEEPELTTGPGVSGVARFNAGASTYVVDPSGSIVRWKRSPLPDAAPSSADGPGELMCIVDDTYVSVLAKVPDGAGDFFPPSELIGEIHLQPADGAGDRVTAGTVPPGVLVQGVFCGAGIVTFFEREVATNFHLGDRTWSTTPSNLSGPSMWISPISGRFATSADGEAAFAQVGSGVILRRVGTGLWETTGAAGHVFATDRSVLVVGDDRTVTQVWPT